MTPVEEVMAIGRKFEETLQICDENLQGYCPHLKDFKNDNLKKPMDKRMIFLQQL